MEKSRGIWKSGVGKFGFSVKEFFRILSINDCFFTFSSSKTIRLSGSSSGYKSWDWNLLGPVSNLSISLEKS